MFLSSVYPFAIQISASLCWRNSDLLMQTSGRHFEELYYYVPSKVLSGRIVFGSDIHFLLLYLFMYLFKPIFLFNIQETYLFILNNVFICLCIVQMGYHSSALASKLECRAGGHRLIYPLMLIKIKLSWDPRSTQQKLCIRKVLGKWGRRGLRWPLHQSSVYRLVQICARLT